MDSNHDHSLLCMIRSSTCNASSRDMFARMDVALTTVGSASRADLAAWKTRRAMTSPCRTERVLNLDLERLRGTYEFNEACYDDEPGWYLVRGVKTMKRKKEEPEEHTK